MTLEQFLQRLTETLSGIRAKEIAAGLARYHRTQASPGYDEAIDYVGGLLDAADIASRVHEFPADGRSKTYEWTVPPAWTIRSGRLVQLGSKERELTRFDEVPQCVLAHSPGGVAEGRLVHAGKGTSPEDYEGLDVAGAFVLAFGRGPQVVKAAAERGAVGVVNYPETERAAACYDLVQYVGIFPRADEISNLVPAFSISRRMADRLLRALAKDEVCLRGEVDAEFTDRPLRVLEAWVEGSDSSAGEVLLTAHICHPRQSANDNASGSAVLVELARVLGRLREEIPLCGTVRFLWVPEFYGTLPWAAERVAELQRTCFVINLDMVGQSPEAIGEPLRFFRAPNTAPSYINAAVEPIAAQVTERTDAVSPQGSKRPLHWIFDQPSGGSDHLVFAASPHGLPALMLGHNDPYWHTDLDTIDKVDPTRLKHVALIAGVLAALPSLAAEEAPLLCEWTLSYSVRALTKASALARDLGPTQGMRLLDIALSVEESRVRSLEATLPAENQHAVGKRLIEILRAVKESMTTRPKGGASTSEAAGSRPKRLIDGPLVYSITERFTEEENEFFKEKLSANHRALVESLLNLCDGTRSANDIALQLSLDAGQIVPTEDIVRGIELLASVGYIDDA